MESKDYNYTFSVEKSPKEIYDQILNVRGWWSGLYAEVFEGNSEKINDEFSFTAGGGMHYSRQKLIELIPGKKVVWLVIDSNLSFLEKPDEWNNTRIIFEITEQDGGSLVTFTHLGLVPDFECYNGCSSAWTQYMIQFAKGIVENSNLKYEQ